MNFPTQVYFCVTLTKESLFKRNISHFGPTTLRATICSALLTMADVKPGDVVVDPMCGGGSIPIEGKSGGAPPCKTPKPEQLVKKSSQTQKSQSVPEETVEVSLDQGPDVNPEELEAKKFALIMQMMQKQLDDRFRELKKGKKKKSKKVRLKKASIDNVEATKSHRVKEEEGDDKMSTSSLKISKPEQSTDNQQLESVPKKLANGLLLKPVEASVAQGLKLMPVSPREVAHLVRKARAKIDPETVTDMTNEDQECLDDSLLDDILSISGDYDKVSDCDSESKLLIFEENECDTCFKQFSSKWSFRKHKKMGDCKIIICKEEHDHDYKIRKFGSGAEALAFGKSFGKTHCNKKTKQTHVAHCREKGCPAHWSFRETERPSGKVEFVFRGCLAHGLNCRHHESNLQKTKEETELKLRKSYTLRKILPNWESAMQYFRDEDQDLIFKLNGVRRDGDGNLKRKNFLCHRGGEPKNPGSKNFSKKVGCPARCSLRKTSKGIQFAGNFNHNHEEFEGARRRGGWDPRVKKKRMCDKCPYYGHALLRHVEVVHEKLKPYLCSECPYVASSNGNLKKHVKNVHKTIIPYKCEKCPYAAEFMVDFRKHVREFHQDPKKPNDGAEATEMCIRELDDIRAKLLSGEMDKSELLDLSNFVVKMKGITQERGQKRAEPDFEREDPNSDHQNHHPNKLRKIRKPSSDEKIERD